MREPGLRLDLIVVSALMATTCESPALCAQTIARSNGPSPITVQLSYTGELVGNVAGGVRRGAVFAGAGGIQGSFLLGHLIGWRGARLFVFALGTHGGAPSDLVGDIQGVSNIEAPPDVRLEELWLQQNLQGNRLSLLVGRYDLNTEFYRLQSGATLINSSFGIGPEFGLSGRAGPSIFPNTSVGARVALKPSPNVVWRVAVLDGVPVNRPSGTQLFAPGDGALLVGELALLSRPDTAGEPRHRRFQIGRGPARPYTAKLALGGWYYTAQFPDLVDTVSSGAPVEHQGSGGAYLIGDVTIWSRMGPSPKAITGFAQLGLGDERVNQIGSYFGGGLTFTGPFPGRTQDVLAVGIAAAQNGSHYELAQTSGETAAASETTVELTYIAQLGSWLSVQSDVQYVIHPGGTRATASAVVSGLRIVVSR